MTLVTACGADSPAVPRMQAGDAQAGRRAIISHGCGACHEIPGVPGAHGVVGPPLRAFSRGVYVAGKFPNEPRWLMRWLLNPPGLAPETAMPAVGLTEREAVDIAAYLYELR